MTSGRWRPGFLLLLICAVAMPASSSAAPIHGDEAAVSPAWSALVASMDAMHAAMASTASSGSSDEDFVRLMIPHHQAAIDMAKAELLYGKDERMRRLAQEIITDQQSEIELMRLWLSQRCSGSPKQKVQP